MALGGLGGNENVMHNSSREARDSISAFTHELGRGHRRKRRSSASNALADESGRLRKSPLEWESVGHQPTYGQAAALLHPSNVEV